MPHRIPQSVAIRVPLKCYLSSDHVSDATGLDPAITISLNGAAFGNPQAGATVATEIGNGWYYVDLGTTDTGTLGPLVIRGTHATMDPTEIVYQVVNANNMGAAALPNAAAEAAGGLFTRGTGAGQINQAANGNIDCNAVKQAGTTLTARDIGASVLLSSGTGAGQLDFTSGVVKSNLAQILGTALTETAGQIAAAFKKFFDKATPTGTINSLPDAVAGASGGVAIVGSVMGKSPATLAAADVSGNLPSDTQTIKGQAVTCAAGVTILANVGAAGAPGANNGFPTTNGTKLNQTVDLTAGQSIAVSDKTGFSLSTAGVQAIWDALTSALTTVGSIGKLLVDRIDAAISTRSTYAGGAVASVTGDVGGKVLGGGASAITGTGARVVDASGNDVAPASTALSSATWTNTKAGYLDENVSAAKTLTVAERNAVADAKNVRALAAESYAADGGTPTESQMFWMIWSALADYAIVGTTLTTNKQNGTPAMTFTLDDPTNPTSRTRAT